MRRAAKAAKQELAHVHPTKIPIRQSSSIGGEVSNGKHLRRIDAAAVAKDLPDLRTASNAPKSRRRKKRDGGGAATPSSESVAEPCRLGFVVYTVDVQHYDNFPKIFCVT